MDGLEIVWESVTLDETSSGPRDRGNGWGRFRGRHGLAESCEMNGGEAGVGRGVPKD